MLRSGWSISSWRALLPTTISPPGATETTLGTSLSPSSPAMTSGLVRFIHATRLLVVPRSIPTTVSLSNSIWNIGLIDQIRYIFSAVQKASHGGERFAIGASVPLAECVLQRAIDFRAHGLKLLSRRFQLRKVGLL